MSAPAYVEISASRYDGDSPADEQLFTDMIGNTANHKERLDQIGVSSSMNIYDDFGQALDTDNWIDTGDVAPSMGGALNHYAELSTSTSGANNSSGIGASAKKMRFDLDGDHTIRMICRWGKATASGDQEVIVGFQDASLTLDAACGQTQDSVICFRKGTGANTLKAYCSKTAGNNVTIADNLSDWRNWVKLQIDITFSGATKKVEFFVDDASVGSTTDTAKIPVVVIRPMIGQYGGSGSRISRVDRAAYFWMVAPEAP